MNDLRIALGFDSHPAEEGRPLRLGGVEFHGEPGLAGHSDGDVVCHAIADAVLGAAGLGDIGQHFPDSDPAVAGIGGLDLLGRAVGLVASSNLSVASCDVTIVAERPMLGPRRAEIRSSLASALGAEVGRVSVKATRPEGLGLRGDGAACIALAVLGAAVSDAPGS